MAMLNASERRFVEANELCRLATTDENSQPHVVPVAYIYYNNKFYIATDLDTRKLANIRRNNKVALVIDKTNPNRAVMVQGLATILLRGEEYRTVYKIFYDRFAWVRRDPWQEGEAALIAVEPLKVVSWGLRQ